MRKPSKCGCGYNGQEEGMPFLLVNTILTKDIVNFKWECPNCGNIINIVDKIEKEK